MCIRDRLVNLTVKEVNELATILKEEYGIEPAAAAVAVAAGDVYKRQDFISAIINFYRFKGDVTSFNHSRSSLINSGFKQL